MAHQTHGYSFVADPLRPGDDCSRICTLHRPAAGRPVLPVVFGAPHSGRCYPGDFVRDTALPLRDLRRSEDFLVDGLFSAAPDAGCWQLVAHRPRAWLDLNRAPDELDPEMFDVPPPQKVRITPRVSAGLGVIPRLVAEGMEIYDRPLSWSEAEERLRTGYHPYHERLRRLLLHLRDHHGQAVLVDCHSMPASAARAMTPLGGRRPHVILGDRNGTSCSPLLTDALEELFTAAGLRVSRNRVYAGGYITGHYGASGLGMHAIQIEINRELYMDERRLAPSADYEELKRIITGVIRALPHHISRLWGGMPIAAE